ncbi:hypothetical protein GF354_00350 [Candidatus Peregrinibacteria bacterium]|nr:hypothetical protein [Candidatus Peregrinibacteria bacterium]
MNGDTENQIIELIKRKKRILILPSSPIDGDSLGSAVALYLALKKLDKEVTVVCIDPVPDVLKFLPHSNIVGSEISSSKDFIITLDSKKTEVDSIKSNIEKDKVNIIITPKDGAFSEEDVSFNKGKIEYDLVFTVDCAELSQLKKIYEDNVELFHQIPVVNIDHHISNTHYGKVNYVDIMASSTAELLVPILEKLGHSEKKDLLDTDIATLLLAGIITDTGSFQNANTTPKSFEVSAKLVSYGARQQEIIQHVYKTKQLSQLKLWGRVLSKIQTDEKYRIVWSTVSKQDILDTGSSEDETGGIIDELMTNAPGAEIVLLIKEKSDDSVSVSLRTTTPSVNSSKIAEEFGGGGHTQAAGFSFTGISLKDVEYKVINYIRELQVSRLGLDDEEKEPTVDFDNLMKKAAENQQKIAEIEFVKDKKNDKAEPKKSQKKAKGAPKPEKTQKKSQVNVEKDVSPKKNKDTQQTDSISQTTSTSQTTPPQEGVNYKFED